MLSLQVPNFALSCSLLLLYFNAKVWPMGTKCLSVQCGLAAWNVVGQFMCVTLLLGVNLLYCDHFRSEELKWSHLKKSHNFSLNFYFLVCPTLLCLLHKVKSFSPFLNSSFDFPSSCITVLEGSPRCGWISIQAADFEDDGKFQAQILLCWWKLLNRHGQVYWFLSVASSHIALNMCITRISGLLWYYGMLTPLRSLGPC